MRVRTHFLALAPFIFVALGCARGGVTVESLAGKWEGKVDSKDVQSGGDPASAMAKSIAENMKMDLDLKSDKTFTMTMMMFPAEGTWSLEGSQVKMQVKKVMGMDLDQLAEKGRSAGAKTSDLGKMKEPMILEVSPDGLTMSSKSVPGAEGRGSLIFKKAVGSVTSK